MSQAAMKVVETEKNPSGIQPLEFNILVLPDQVGEKVGNIFIPDDARDREQVAATEGTVVAVSDTAFTYEHGAQRVEPGDRIVFARYAGMKVKGKDGKEYFILKDKSVAGVYA